jgi:hypothetical protein
MIVATYLLFLNPYYYIEMLIQYFQANSRGVINFWLTELLVDDREHPEQFLFVVDIVGLN